MPNDDPLMLNAGLDALKSGADFQDDGLPAPPLSERASATPASKEKIAFASELGVGANDEIIDIPHRAELDQLTEMVGGPAAMPAAKQAFKEAMSLMGVDSENYDGLVDTLTVEEEHAEILDTIREWNQTLASPEKAAAMLNHLWSRPNEEPMKSYIVGRSSPAVNDAITKLMQAAHGEKPVGRQKPRGDGFVK